MCPQNNNRYQIWAETFGKLKFFKFCLKLLYLPQFAAFLWFWLFLFDISIVQNFFILDHFFKFFFISLLQRIWFLEFSITWLIIFCRTMLLDFTFCFFIWAGLWRDKLFLWDLLSLELLLIDLLYGLLLGSVLARSFQMTEVGRLNISFFRWLTLLVNHAFNLSISSSSGLLRKW